MNNKLIIILALVGILVVSGCNQTQIKEKTNSCLGLANEYYFPEIFGYLLVKHSYDNNYIVQSQLEGMYSDRISNTDSIKICADRECTKPLFQFDMRNDTCNGYFSESNWELEKMNILDCPIKTEIHDIKELNITYYNGTINKINYLIGKDLFEQVMQNKTIICGAYCGGERTPDGLYEQCFYTSYYGNPRSYEQIYCCFDEYCTDMGQRRIESYMEC